jgi:SAM-dependent methyltransferase
LANYLDEDLVSEKKILHFAPEIGLINFIKKLNPAEYICGDLNPKSNQEKINIEKINYPSNHFDLIIASHILEHVDDNACLKELKRVVKKNGKVLLMFPVINSWDKTYQNEKIVQPYERELHFGQFDHVRLYGNDVEDLFINHGFQFEKIITDGADSVIYALDKGETLYILS